MENNKDFDLIMKSITGELTGNSEDDIKYLMDQCEKYKEHEYGKEIIRACSRLMYEIMPEEKKAELNKAIAKDQKGFDAAMEEIRFNIYEKNYDKAMELMEALVSKYEKGNIYEEDAVSLFFCFRSPMEEMLYTYYNEPQKTIRKAPFDYAAIYLQYGSLLIDVKRFEDANKALAKAYRWNPASARIAFEYAESFKLRGMIKEFFDITKETFKYACDPESLARCYRNTAYYLVETGEYKAAVCCLLFSAQYEKTEMVSSELYFISRKLGEMYEPSDEEIAECFKEFDIPFGPAAPVLQIAYHCGIRSKEEGNLAAAQYFLRILASFVKDEEVERILKEIEEKET